MAGGGERWWVGCRLELGLAEPATVVLSAAPATSTGARIDERLTVAVDGVALDAEVIAGDHGGVVHVLRAPAGQLAIGYDVELDRPAAGSPAPPADTFGPDQVTYLRPSRYCPSDRLRGFAVHELGAVPVGSELIAAVGTWVAQRLTYAGGSTGPLDTAIDVLLAGRGVCRDFAHLAITMLRALEVPARLVSVYAPGLTPMDFHAVVEAWADGQWLVVDPSRLAPRQTYVRVATGRDAADTAFLTVLGSDGGDLRAMAVTAATDHDLPYDDHLAACSLP